MSPLFGLFTILTLFSFVTIMVTSEVRVVIAFKLIDWIFFVE